jgi:hypothetical protein
MWFVGFTDTPANPRPWWLAPFLRQPGFRHVLAWRELPGQAGTQQAGTLVINPCLNVLDIHTRPIDPAQFARVMMRGHNAAVLLVPLPPPGRVPVLRYWPTCTEIIKAALGIEAPGVITPHQLYGHLRAAGALRVTPTTKEPAL